MDRDFLKDNMSAYLDGELAPKQMREFERDIEQYPDLFAELQALQRLNKLALDSQVPLPDDRYFDKLAEQIDSQVKRESPQDRGRIVNFLLERRKTVAIISSVAAVFLVAIIGMNLFGPSAKRYPKEIRNIEINPAILESPKTDTVTIWPEHEKQIVPPPVIEDNVKVDTLPRRTHKLAVKEETAIRGLDTISVLKPNTLTLNSIGTPIPDTIQVSTPDTVHRDIQIVTAGRQMYSEPQTTKGGGLLKVKPNALSESTSSAPAESPSYQGVVPLRDAIPALSGRDTITIRTESIIPGITDARYPKLKDSEIKSIQPDTAQFRGAGDLPWTLYIRAFNRMNQGVIDGWRLSALTSSRDSLQSWADSIHTIGPGLWNAEQAFRSLQQPNISWDDYQLWRAYIDYYLADSPNADSILWNQRLIGVNEILERFLGKQFQK